MTFIIALTTYTYAGVFASYPPPKISVLDCHESERWVSQPIDTSSNFYLLIKIGICS
jgi:hypothetical protein